MKKRFVFAMLTAIALFAICGLTGCSYFGSVTYVDSDKYTIGDAEITEKIENIEIDWPSGSVSVISHSENTFTLSEKAEDEISDEFRLHWWLEDTTLHVKFAASGASLRLFGTLHKDMTLAVPEALYFDDVTIRAASAKIDVRDLVAETLSVSTASGDMNIGCAANIIRLNSASGKVQLNQEDEVGEVSIDTASGKIDVNLGRVDRTSVESASGKIKVMAVSVDSLSAKATSGDVTLLLPDDSDFTANISTTSGEFESDFALKKDGSTYICGRGSADIDIETTSGDVSIWQKSLH